MRIFNNESTRLTGKKPPNVIRTVMQTPSLPSSTRFIDLEESLLLSSAIVWYLSQPEEFEGGRRRATDSIWSLNVHNVKNVTRQRNQPAL